MKTKNGKRILAIISVILFAIIAILIPIFAMAGGIEASAAEIEQPTENNSIPFAKITTNGEVQTEPTQDFLYFECHNSQGWYRVDLKLTQAIKWNNFTMKFVYSSQFGGSFAQTNFLNGSTNVGQYNISNSEYNTITITQSNILYKTGTGFDTFRIWLNNGNNTGSNNYIMYYFLSIVDMATSTGKPIAYYHSFLYDIIDKRQETGYNQGYEEGETAGQEAGYNQGYEEGETAGQEAGYNQGYEEGETIGHEAGYNQGYTQGYDAGVSAGLTNPIEYFIKPIDEFMSIKIFGTLAIGNILSIILFVAIALIFLKMFAGG